MDVREKYYELEELMGEIETLIKMTSDDFYKDMLANVKCEMQEEFEELAPIVQKLEDADLKEQNEQYESSVL